MKLLAIFLIALGVSAQKTTCTGKLKAANKNCGKNTWTMVKARKKGKLTLKECFAAVAAECPQKNFATWRSDNGACHCQTGTCKKPITNKGLNIYDLTCKTTSGPKPTSKPGPKPTSKPAPVTPKPSAAPANPCAAFHKDKKGCKAAGCIGAKLKAGECVGTTCHDPNGKKKQKFCVPVSCSVFTKDKKCGKAPGCAWLGGACVAGTPTAKPAKPAKTPKPSAAPKVADPRCTALTAQGRGACNKATAFGCTWDKKANGGAGECM